jgi:putative FmdB family regulatory protein
MPLYEFQCESCGKTIEKICTFKETQKNLTCTRCEGKMVLLLSTPNIVTDETRRRRIEPRGRSVHNRKTKGRI